MALLLLSTSSCVLGIFGGDDDDEMIVDFNAEANDELQGEWDVSSWRVDTVELIPEGIESWLIGFERSNPAAGDLTWTIDSNREDLLESGVFTGTYSVSDNGETLTMGGQSYDMDLRTESFRLDAEVDGVPWVILADRD